jgi:hypothetical protein
MLNGRCSMLADEFIRAVLRVVGSAGKEFVSY